MPLSKRRKSPEKLKKTGVHRRRRYNLSFDTSVMEPFRSLCESSDMPLSRVFEGIADVFIKSMRPGEDFRREYTEMLSLYYNYRRDCFELPREIPPEKILP